MNLDHFKLFLLEGKFLDFSGNTLESDVVSTLGTPSETEEYGASGKFLHYDDIRFSIANNGLLEYVDCFFMNTNLSFAIRISDEDFIINKNFGIAQMLRFLNLNGIKWNVPYELSKLDYMVVELAKGVRICYYYESDKLERVTRVFSTAQ